MAKETQDPEAGILSKYAQVERFFEKHQQLFSYILGGIAIVIAGYFGYQYFYLSPLNEEAQEQMFKAQAYFEQDSLWLAINGDGNYLGFQAISQEYSGTQAANLSQYYLGISYLRLRNYQQAIQHLQKYKPKDLFTASIAKGAMGDAYMELGNTAEAAKYYKAAASTNPNSFSTPIYLQKAGMALEQLDKPQEAKAMYERIKKEYPDSPEAQQVDKYIARAEARMQVKS